MRTNHLAAAVLVIVGGFTLAACGGSTGSMSGMSSSADPMASGASAGDFNNADVTFATEMISHHRQAVEMATFAPTRAKSQKVKDLAAQIREAQDPQIQMMSGWLTSWAKPLPAEMSGMDMSSAMPGMMSDADMGKLKNSTGAVFDQMFLTLMIKHHQGAIKMAQVEQANGRSPNAIALAKRIETAQTQEIATMHGLLG